MWKPALIAAMLVLRCLTVHAQTPSTLTVRPRQVAKTFQAYGEVQPVAVTQLRAVEAGVVKQLMLPGEQVKAGQVLAVLGGLQPQSLLAERRGALRAASIQLAADRGKLAAQLVTQQAVAADEAAYEAARGRLQVVLQNLTLRAPAGGQVLTVDAGDGEQVAAGQLILTLQTTQPLLSAAFYGPEALSVHPGMNGRFQPVSGVAIPVRVRTVSLALAPDGGEQVWLSPVLSRENDLAAPANSWRSGQWGTVTLVGTPRLLIAVPTRALILDQARWWVLVRTPHGDRRQEVVSGPTSGSRTYILQGLKPGEEVVVENAYLEFHRGISQRYAPPD